MRWLLLVVPAACYSVVPHSRTTLLRAAAPGRAAAAKLQTLDLLSAVDSFYQTAPYQAAFLTCGVKASLSDTISQKTVEKVQSSTGEVSEHRFCFSRNFAFILYGGLYQGVTQHVIFNEIYPAVFGSGTDLQTVAVKVLFDQLVLTPFLCLPIAYLVKAAVFQYPLQEGLDKYVMDAKKDLLWKYWAIWTPTQCLTFSVVPEHLRIPFIAMVSFFWLIILSNITSRPLPTAPGKAIICFDDQCIVAGEIDDDFDVSVLDAGVVVPTGSASNSAEITADVAEEASGVDGNR